MGMYRMHVFDARTTGMHWQIQKGGGFHYARAEKLGVPLEVAVALGTDPALLLAFEESCQRMRKTRAIVKIARKLLNRVRYVLKNQTPYRMGVVQ
jgi:UbiD family decarboxylase